MFWHSGWTGLPLLISINKCLATALFLEEQTSHSHPTPPIVHHLTSMCVGYDEGNHFPKKKHQITPDAETHFPLLSLKYLTKLRVKRVYSAWLCKMIFCFFVLKLKFVNNVCFGGCWNFLLSCFPPCIMFVYVLVLILPLRTPHSVSRTIIK